ADASRMPRILRRPFAFHGELSEWSRCFAFINPLSLRVMAEEGYSGRYQQVLKLIPFDLCRSIEGAGLTGQEQGDTCRGPAPYWSKIAV
ncbi:MAG TPA: hypothetical protein VHK01_07620, partial [Lacipirellulaceae bacterium]|nr:hypothetical protein [Lacipirellulaceae bacterium]